MVATNARSIVIVGGGIVGVSTAYFLTRHPMFNSSLHSITLLEASSIAIGSSGKGGGFIASWATPKCIAPLSFKLHKELARDHDGARTWGFRLVYAAEVKLQATQVGTDIHPPSSGATDHPAALDWLAAEGIKGYNEIGTPADSGQVHPYLLTRALAQLAEEKGANIFIGTARSINYRNSGSDKSVQSVTYTSEAGEQSIEATDVLIAAGPWSSRLLPALKLLTPKGHSIVVRSSRALSPYIVFPDIESTSNLLSPDIYPRPSDSLNDFDTVYSSGPDYYDHPLPEVATDIVVENNKCDDVWEAVKSVTTDDVSKGDIIMKQACYKAQIRKHEEDEEVGPMVGPLETQGLWLATGLDEWGIQNGPAAGLVMSEMIMDGKAKSADVAPLDPKRWM
ncbi:FAD dependent oxidoreductase [Xylariaceae sp. FL0255]|nr:FAD dependent oxidoreductase [Xylariaceae sp. FL0255]